MQANTSYRRRRSLFLCNPRSLSIYQLWQNTAVLSEEAMDGWIIQLLVVELTQPSFLPFVDSIIYLFLSFVCSISGVPSAKTRHPHPWGLPTSIDLSPSIHLISLANGSRLHPFIHSSIRGGGYRSAVAAAASTST